METSDTTTTPTTLTPTSDEQEAAAKAEKAEKRDATFKLMRTSFKEILKITGLKLEPGGAQKQYFESIVDSVQQLKAKVDAFEEEKRKQLEEETKLGAESVAAVAAARPPPHLLEDPEVNKRIQEARKLLPSAKEKFPSETGLEPGLTFHDTNGVKYVVIAFDKAKPINSIVCVAHRILTHTATGFIQSHIHFFNSDFVIGKLSKDCLARIRTSRVDKYHAKFNIPSVYTTDGFFLQIDGENLRCRVHDIHPLDKKRPIHVVCLKTNKVWSYPVYLLLNKAVPIVDHMNKRKAPFASSAPASASSSNTRLPGIDTDESEDDDDDDDDDGSAGSAGSGAGPSKKAKKE